MRKKLAMALTAAMVSAALSVPSMGAPSGNGGMLNYLNVIIMPIDDNYSSTDFIQATLTPDDGAQAAKAQSCSGQIAATNFLFAPSGTVTFNKEGYHTEPASWHVDADNFDNQTLEFTLIPDNYTGDLRAAAKPEVTFDTIDVDDSGSFITPKKRLIMTTSTPDATIRYTTDGSEPGYESTRYSGPIVLDADTTFKAIATKSGYVKSPVMEYQYNAPAEKPKIGSVTISGAIVDENGTPIPYVVVDYDYAHGSSGSGITIPSGEDGQFTLYEYSRNVGTLKFSKEGYVFDSVDVNESYDGSTLTIIGRSTAAPAETVPETSVSETPAPAETVPEASAEEAASGEVTVYQNNNYGGKSLTLKEGRYRMSQLSKVGNDAISSIKVPEGWTVTLYEHDNYKGRTLICTSDIPLLGEHKFNDATSSIVVQTTAAEETLPEETVPETTAPEEDSLEVTVYQNVDYGGKSLALKEGRYRMSQLSKVGNDAISSIKVPEGWTVTLYEHDNYKGKSLVCESDISRLGEHKFNDITSSIVVQKN